VRAGKLFRSADNLAREHTERAIKTLAAVMDDDIAEDRDRISAANALLDRGHGKPVHAVIQVPLSRQLQNQLAGMSDEALEAAMIQAPLPRLTRAMSDIIEADIEPSIDPLLR
jgi:hypothetical protein